MVLINHGNVFDNITVINLHLVKNHGRTFD